MKLLSIFSFVCWKKNEVAGSLTGTRNEMTLYVLIRVLEKMKLLALELELGKNGCAMQYTRIHKSIKIL